MIDGGFRQETGALKVLFVTGIFPPDIGGPAAYVSEMAIALAMQGHQVTVVALRDDPLGHPKAIRLVTIRRRAFLPWRWAQTIRALLRHGREADVLLVAGLPVEASIANLVLRKPALYRVVGDPVWERCLQPPGLVAVGFEEFQRSRYGIRVFLLRFLRNWALRRADLILTPSQYFADHIRSWGVPPDRIRVLHSPLLPIRDPAPFDVPLDVPVKLVMLGRLIVLKQVDIVLESLVDVVDVGLVVVGDGPERGRLDGLARQLGVSDRVFFAGKQSRDDALRLAAECDIYVLASTHEAFPLALIEAMSLGLPCVVAGVGGVPELIRIAGHALVVEPSREAIIEGIHRAVRNLSHDRDLAKQEQARVRERFGFAEFEQETGRIMLEMLNGRSRK